MSKVKLIIVEDHQVVRQGLTAILDLHPQMKVIGQAASGEEAIELATRLRPDVVLMDVRMPGMGGIEACRAIRKQFPSIKVLMLTSFSDDDSVMASILAGAAGYVLKETDAETLFRSISLVAQGQCLLDPAVTDKVFTRLKDLTGSKHPSETEANLTPQEKRILKFMADGNTNREIADQLHLSEKTVRNYVSSLLDKLHMDNRTQAAVFFTKTAKKR
ncbi:MAG: response regulator transcription factor [Bacillota bacterium]